MTRSREQLESALVLRRQGLNSSAIARALTVPRSTIRDWVSGGHPRRERWACFRCNDEAAAAVDRYVYLLGLYLGDGSMSLAAGGVWKLRIFQDTRYTVLIAQCYEAMGAVLPNRVGEAKKLGCVEIYSYSKHWIHLFPQHGPGPKHLRPIELEPWQRAMIEEQPKQFLRGLIHSDGCRSLNTIRRPMALGERVYTYPRYAFTNASADIRRMFTDACDMLGVHWTQTNGRNLAVSRRTDVAFLDTFIGPKS